MTATPGSFRPIDACRLCGSPALASLLDLGTQALTGVFPRDRATSVRQGPLEIVKCFGAPTSCGLVQLRHSYPLAEMYGADYGYRSALNRAMVEHLHAKVDMLLARVALGPGDAVLDIGSNDGTTLSFYPRDATLVGIDPTAVKFAKYYAPHVRVVADFFSPAAFFRESGGRRAKIVTSVAMLYDLEHPLDFVRGVHEVLADDGVWHFEQSYLPSMLEAKAYDTICQEHVEYYALEQIVWMLDRVGFSIVDARLNDVNGGSIALTATRSAPGRTQHDPAVQALLDRERSMQLGTLAPFTRFAERVAHHREALRDRLVTLKHDGKRVVGMGASTKGNVILQYCGLGPDLVSCIAEVNEDKFGCFTPGTGIPIVSEAEAAAQNPDVYLVFPWHFRKGLVARAAPLLARGVKLLFPLPEIELVSAS